MPSPPYLGEPSRGQILVNALASARAIGDDVQRDEVVAWLAPRMAGLGRAAERWRRCERSATTPGGPPR